MKHTGSRDWPRRLKIFALESFCVPSAQSVHDESHESCPGHHHGYLRLCAHALFVSWDCRKTPIVFVFLVSCDWNL